MKDDPRTARIHTVLIPAGTITLSRALFEGARTIFVRLPEMQATIEHEGVKGTAAWTIDAKLIVVDLESATLRTQHRLSIDEVIRLAIDDHQRAAGHERVLRENAGLKQQLEALRLQLAAHHDDEDVDPDACLVCDDAEGEQVRAPGGTVH